LLDKGNPDDWRQLNALYRACDAFILPTAAEGYGIVFAEAAAYGLPSLAYETIGVRTAVKQGQSGVLLAPGSGPEDFAAVIEGWYETPAAYEVLSKGARAHFEETVNWGTAVSRLGTVIEEFHSEDQHE
jgi:glycosyltransferase involved in cell wall biosynthesis